MFFSLLRFFGSSCWFFLLTGWYAYFIAVRWLSLNQVAVGYSRFLSEGLFSKKTVQLWVLVFFFVGSLILFLDDFYVLVSWFFF